jgi:hypothetical protein
VSRSYRRPYSTISGRGSSRIDKTFANRGVRRTQNAAVRRAIDFDEFLVPDRYEAPHNDVWGWRRDGKQRLQRLQHNDFNPFYVMSRRTSWNYEEMVKYRDEILEKRIQWIESLKRK